LAVSSRGDTAQVALIQVGTPIRGKSQRLSTIHAASNPIHSQTSDIFFRSKI
jgi:hypothetical protein